VTLRAAKSITASLLQMVGVGRSAGLDWTAQCTIITLKWTVPCGNDYDQGMVGSFAHVCS